MKLKLLAILILMAGFVSTSYAATVTCDPAPGPLKGSVRFQNFGNCGCEIDAIMFKNSIPSNFLQFDYENPGYGWSSQSEFSIVYSSLNQTLILTIIADGHEYIKVVNGFNPDDLGFISFMIEDQDNLGEVVLTNLYVNGQPFNAPSCDEFLVTDICIKNGFELTGTLMFEGEFLCNNSYLVVGFGGEGDCDDPENLPPDCSDASVEIPGGWPPTDQTINTDVEINIKDVYDPEADNVTITYNWIYQTQPVDGANCANTDDGPDAVISNNGHTATVRLERCSDDPDGRVYRINFTATDQNGGSCTKTVTLCIPQNLNDPNPTCNRFNQTWYISTEANDQLAPNQNPKVAYANSERTVCGETSEVPGLEIVFEPVSPNPASNYADFKLMVAQDNMVKVTLLDAIGNQVGVIYNNIMKAGQEYPLTADVSGLAPGIYVLNITGQGFVRQQKIMVVK